MLRQITIAAVLVTSAWVYEAHCQCVPRPSQRLQESFVSLATVAGLPYPSGAELVLKENGNRVEAVLRNYAGEPQPRESKLTGAVEEKRSGKTTVCEVDLAGTNKSGAIRIHGTISPINFLGTIERRVGSDT